MGVTPEHGSWKAEAEQVRPDDEDSFNKAYLSMEVILAGLQGVQDAVAKILVGENILTPSLTNKGWKFWKPLLLTESEKRAVESAHMRGCEAAVTQYNALREKYGKLSDEDTRTALIGLACLIDVECSWMQQLSADLKRILLNAKKE